MFTLNAVSFVAVIVAMASGNYPSIPRSAHREQMLGAMTAAIRYARHAPAMRAVLFRGAVHIFAAVAPVVLLPFLVRSRGWEASGFGVLMSCYGAGAILVAHFILPRLRTAFSFDQVLAGASLTSAFATAALALQPPTVHMGLVLAVAGAGWMSGLNTFSVASQSVFPNWVRARSSAIYLVTMQEAFATGAITWGYIAGHLKASAALFIAAAGLLVGGLLTRLIPSVILKTRPQPLRPLARTPLHQRARPLRRPCPHHHRISH